jgi:YjbE family integral membrane protein
METFGAPALKILEIIWINVVLSGDNAVVIALACRGLPPRRRRAGMLLGAAAAVLLRLVFTVVVVTLLATPFLKLAGGVFLLWIAVKLLVDEPGANDRIAETDRLWKAVRTVAVADAVMSLDNVLAIAAVAQDSTFLLILGLLISVPLIVAGSALIMALLERLPILVWAGAALLGWLAGEMMVSDPWIVGQVGVSVADAMAEPAAVAGAVLVVAWGIIGRRTAETAK